MHIHSYACIYMHIHAYTCTCGKLGATGAHATFRSPVCLSALTMYVSGCVCVFLVCLCWYVCVCVCVSSRACCSTVCIVGVQGHITPLTSSFDKSQLFGSLVAESPDFVKHEL